MSPRPRTIDDGAILAACQRVMQRVGPARFTLALVGEEAGISAATVVQRFGSKRRLLRAMSASATGFAPAMAAELRAAHPSPLAAARAFLLGFAHMASSPREMAHHLAWLQMDLTDPVMLRHLASMSEEHREVVAGLLEEAVAAGELVPGDMQALARVLLALVTGGLLAWATHREGTAREWLARDLEVVLAPALMQRTRGRRSRGVRRR